MRIIDNNTNKNVSDDEQKIRGKTPVIGETSTGCCLSNEVKSTIKIVRKYTLSSLLLVLTSLLLCFCKGIYTWRS